MTKEDREDHTIESFCACVAMVEANGPVVVSRPDRENPGIGGCDAVVSWNGAYWALEHTTIDAYLEQRADTARFKEVVLPLEESLSAAFPTDRIEIAVPSHAIPTGTSWVETRKRLQEGLLAELPRLPRNQRSRTLNIKGVPFPVTVWKMEPAYMPGCFVLRISPADQREQLVSAMERAIRDKSRQLAPYREKGMPTVLLIEWEDLALLNEIALADAFRRACDTASPTGLGEVFLADATRRRMWFFPVKRGAVLYPDLADFKSYLNKQYLGAYGPY